ncbi:MAG: hypothetical protein EOP09_06695, partial [Proteobacteria bacterium]
MQTTVEESSRWRRKASDFVGYGTVVATIAILFFFLVLPVSVIMARAFYSNGEFTFRYFPLLFQNELLMGSIWNSVLI